MLRSCLNTGAPKMGCDDDLPDLLAKRVLDAFGRALAGKTNKQGGIWKGGTATAMYYLWHAAEVGATPDGRRKNEPFGTNFSPNLFTAAKGPVSVIRSFTKQNYRSVPNGGPLTLEFAGSIFAKEDSIDNQQEFGSFVTRSLLNRIDHYAFE